MFLICADKNQLYVRRREPVTSGSVNVYTVRFSFSKDWEGLERTAFFAAGTVCREVPLGGGGECAVPREVLERHGLRLRAGVRGDRNGETVLPTVWADLGMILEGASGKSGAAPEPWEEALAGKGDGLGYTEDGKLGLFSGDKLLSSVSIQGGGESVSDHRTLTGRDAERQHPISAIEGLEEELRRIPAPVEPMTNEELEEILK